MTKTARVYRIEMLIRNRGHVSFRELLDELEVSPATLKRDIEYLRDQLGAPIEYDRFHNGYRLAPQAGGTQHELPGMWFSERELYSLLMAHQLLAELDSQGAISRHLQPLMQRIHQMLGTVDAGDVLQRVKIVSPAKRPVATPVFERVAEALLQRRRLHMRYLTRARSQTSEREVSPQRLVHYRNTWYLDAWCHTRDDLLRFALDAIESAGTLETSAKDLPLTQVEERMDAGYGIYAGAKPHWATLVFSAQAAPWVSHEEWHPRQQGSWLADGRYQLKLPYTDPTELAMDILRHAGDVEVVADSGTLARTVHERARRAWQAVSKVRPP